MVPAGERGRCGPGGQTAGTVGGGQAGGEKNRKSTTLTGGSNTGQLYF